MAGQNTYVYYVQRAAMERKLARTAALASVAEVHMEAAERYENLAQKVALNAVLRAEGSNS